MTVVLSKSCSRAMRLHNPLNIHTAHMGFLRKSMTWRAPPLDELDRVRRRLITCLPPSPIAVTMPPTMTDGRVDEAARKGRRGLDHQAGEAQQRCQIGERGDGWLLKYGSTR